MSRQRICCHVCEGAGCPACGYTGDEWREVEEVTLMDMPRVEQIEYLARQTRVLLYNALTENASNPSVAIHLDDAAEALGRAAKADRSEAGGRAAPTKEDSMEIQISGQAIAEAVAAVVGDGLTAGVKSWEVTSGIKDAVQRAILEAHLPELLHAQLQVAVSEQAGPIVQAVVAEILPALTIAFREAFRGSLIAMVYGLQQGRPHYLGTEEMARWREIEASLLARKEG